MDLQMSPCKLWTGRLDPHGYGRLKLGAIEVLAHRKAYAEYHGLDVLSMGGVVMHLCDNPPCIEPTHLKLGTQSENMADMYSKGRHAKGEDRGNAVLTDEQVRSIRRDYIPRGGANGRGNSAHICLLYGLTRYRLSCIIRRTRWAHVEEV